jgi:hypothetical protein
VDAIDVDAESVQAAGRNVATDAGFRRVEILPIEHDLWRFYLLGEGS